MKVLKTAREDNWGKEMRCVGHGTGKTGGCGALLLVTPRDIESASYHDYDGGSDTSYWFVCPLCGASTYVSYGSWATNR